MTCAQGLLRLLWGGARSWSATGLKVVEREGRHSNCYVLSEITFYMLGALFTTFSYLYAYLYACGCAHIVWS